MERLATPGPKLTKRHLQLIAEFHLDGDVVVRNSTGKPVTPAPCTMTGYQQVKTFTKNGGERFQVSLHRLKFLLSHGFMPPEVDHRDVNGANSSVENLRSATRSQNAMNRKRQSNALSFRGVRKHGKKWLAMLTIEGVCQRLGSYDSPEKASAVVEAIAEQEHGEFYRHPDSR